MSKLPPRPSEGPLLCLGGSLAGLAPQLTLDELVRVTSLVDDIQWETVVASPSPQRFVWVYAPLQALARCPLNAYERLHAWTTDAARLILEVGSPALAAAGKDNWVTLAAHQGWELDQSTGSEREHEGLLVLRKSSPSPRYRLRLSFGTDQAECQALFRRAFNEAVEPRFWSWKYGEGRGLATLAWRSGHAVAHYGGMVRRVRFQGAEHWALQVGDVMVDPAERGVLAKSGAFARAAKAFLDATLGHGGRFSLAYGFPTERAFALGSRLGLYTEVERLTELRWLPLAGRVSLNHAVRPVINPGALAPVIDGLWQQMAAGLAERISVVRDAGYLQYRYADHPRFAYAMFLIKHRWSGKALGLLVLRRDGDLCRWVDVLAPLSHLPVLLACARRIAATWQTRQLVTWITSHQARYFRTPDVEECATNILVPTDNHVRRVPAEEIRDRWWLMMGDTDFL